MRDAGDVQDSSMSETFVHHYVNAVGSDYDQEQLMMTIRDLLTAGMDTTSAAIRWAIVILTNHDSVQQRLHEEIDSVIGRDTMPTLDDRSRSASC